MKLSFFMYLRICKNKKKMLKRIELEKQLFSSMQYIKIA